MSRTDTCRYLRPRAEGKFLWLGEEKFFVRGVTYGAFAPDADGHQFPDASLVERDFTLMRGAGINSILTYTVPPVSLLDRAFEHGLRVIVNVPWMGHVCFLEQASTRRAARLAVRDAVTACRNHPGVLMYAVAKELPPQIIRWHGKTKVEAFLTELISTAKDIDPESLVTYTNFPTTEYLELPSVDVQTFNVYLHQRREFCSYLSRLQHLAGELPLVLTEFGMCSFRHGRQQQAEFLDWQMEEAADHGVAGTVVFSWTDPFYQDSCLVDEWGFGLVDADRRPKPSYGVVRRRFGGDDATSDTGRRWPKVSVVIALYNAERTLDESLASVANLNYPDYEVIVVNDGSTDGSQAIIDRYPYRCITTKNHGISAARNEGLRAATGEIVAYMDSDAYADADWLRYLVRTFQEGRFAGVGGPNLVPPTDNWLAKCVFRSPGGPTQVMLDDTNAEHIPGCNMAFWKWALDEIGGFDPLFTAAGDDVDVCWRLLERGHTLGFSPSAVVWHHRRPSVGAFWRQQVGYGIAESLLERRHPNKYNRWGHCYWRGTIYAPYPRFKLRAAAIYQGLWGSAPFQSIYETGGGGPLAYLPRAMEMHLGLFGLLAMTPLFPWALVPLAAGLIHIAAYCTVCARAADLGVIENRPHRPSWIDRFKCRLLIGWLHFLEPLARDWGRLKGGLTPWRSGLPHHPERRPVTPMWRRLHPFRRSVTWGYTGDQRLEKHEILDQLTQDCSDRGCAVAWNADFDSWDLKLRRGALGEAAVCMVVEHHGGPKRFARFSADIRPNAVIVWTLLLIVGLAFLGAKHDLGPLLEVMAVMTGLVWAALVREADRLEVGVRAATDAICTPRPVARSSRVRHGTAPA